MRGGRRATGRFSRRLLALAGPRLGVLEAGDQRLTGGLLVEADLVDPDLARREALGLALLDELLGVHRRGLLEIELGQLLGRHGGARVGDRAVGELGAELLAGSGEAAL